MDYTCPFCQARSCDTCRRLVAYGTIVESWLRICDEEDRQIDTERWDFLDAVAELLKQHAVDRRRHQKELNEEAREAQRGARDAYQQGREEATRDW